MTTRAHRILLIGALPPPQHGVTGMNEVLLRAVEQSRAFDVRHLDISDRRSISTVEKFDWQNVFAALKHGAQCLWQLLAWRPDVVYVPLSQKALGFLRDALFLVPARLLGRKTVVHLHGGNLHVFYGESNALLRWLIRFSLAGSARAVVLGESLRHTFSGIVPSERICVVPNGIPDFAGEKAAVRHATPHQRLQVLYLGTLAREKGVDVFVQAALTVLGQTDTIEFVVAGPWWRDTDRDAMQSFLQTNPLGRNIQFLGEVRGERKWEALLSSDVLVFPAVQQEGMPLVVLEAMCAGLAVIATDRGCLREVVVEGETGFIVPPGNASAIAEKLLALARDRPLAARVGQAARRRYEQEYRTERFAERMIKVFEFD